jgi:hypothetical protein
MILGEADASAVPKPVFSSTSLSLWASTNRIDGSSEQGASNVVLGL